MNGAVSTSKPRSQRKRDLAETRGESAPQRELTIVAQDPSVCAQDGRILTATATITAEPIHPGPCGARIKVVDYDASRDRLYLPRRGGYESARAWADPFAGESDATLLADPTFHQQNVYAIAMQVIGAFETALGRRVNFGFSGHQLHIAPHAFADANAYYSREDRSLSFGYFPIGKMQTVYTCLSHDVVAHETTHALLDGLRPRYIDPSSADQAGFHEGFADLVALLSVLSQGRLIEAVFESAKIFNNGRKLVDLAQIDAQFLKQSALLGLAEQMSNVIPNGVATALRRSVLLTPNRRWLSDPDYEEPHQRGEILVAAIMNAFLTVWSERIRALLSTGGGLIDGGRVIEEGATGAQHLLTMCLRALDYAPPTDLQFGDFLSALLTADRETVPDDSKYGYRDKVRAQFALWGVNPTSGAHNEGCWKPFGESVSHRNIHFAQLQRDPVEAFRFLWENFDSLKLSATACTNVQAVRPIARVAPDGLLVQETVVDYMQVLAVRGHELRGLGLKRPAEIQINRQVRLYGGGVLVFDEFGQLKYSIGNNIADVQRQQARLDYLARSGFFDYASDEAFSRGYFSRMHRARALYGFSSGRSERRITS
ncbi:hypothetical protein KVP09_06570 [Alcaligenaceae bacterium CGII-47]|nr:hypothetical protein [Alcaligenaceae bacterium CGII-47]